MDQEQPDSPQNLPTEINNTQTPGIIQPETPVASPLPQGPIQPQNPPIVNNPQPKKRTFSKKKLIIIIAVILVVLAAGIAYILISGSSTTTESGDSKNNKNDYTASADDIVVNGNTYFADPKEINDLIFFKSDACEDTDEFCDNGRIAGLVSYQIGFTKDKKQIIGYRASEMPGYTDLILINNNDTYEIAYPKDKYTENDIQGYTAVKATTIPSTSLSELQGEVNPSIKGQRLEGSGTPTFAFLDFDDNGVEKKVTPKTGDKIVTQNDKIYYSISEDKGAYYSKYIIARFGNLLDYNYDLSGEINASDSKADEKITWSKGDATKDTYRTGGGGCGSANNYSVAKTDKKDLVVVGKTPGGQTVYQLPTTDPLVKEIYENDYKKGESTIDKAEYKNLSVEQFTDKHSYFIIENNFGEYVVMLSDSFFAQGGCGKPVVYLYPQKETKVNVAVGADVVISDPLYPTGGWKNVLAKPNGDLIYNGKNYGSLFWEGYGHGAYPSITNGTIVKSSEAPQNIREQLTAQGLQGREIEEFMAFWEPKLPNTPYIRLTWFNNSQLNTLAPLAVTPRPNTIIRTFLDFEGLNKPITIKPQKFTAPERKGFTVVEWGGLLRNGL